jgi:hypothetical protein
LIIAHNVDVLPEKTLYYKSRNVRLDKSTIHSGIGAQTATYTTPLAVSTVSFTLLKHDGCKHLFNDRSCIYCVEITGLIAVFEDKISMYVTSENFLREVSLWLFLAQQQMPAGRRGLM